MITPACKDVVDTALEEMPHLFSSSREDENQCLVRTPFLYPDNTPIGIFIERGSAGELTVTDHGEASDYAFLHGTAPEEFEHRLEKAARRWRLMRDGDELRLPAHEPNLARAMITMVSAIQDLTS